MERASETLKTPSPRHCPQCGAALPGGAAEWLCPKCLLSQAATPPPPDASSSLNPQPSTLNHPHVLHYFGDYELLEEIARGGMGVVYKARQLSLNRIVAVKLLLAGRFSSPEFVERFRAEARAAANLQHPNIVAIHEVGEHEGQQYFSMDYVDGQSLAERARDNPLPPELAADYVRTIAEAIHYAHQRGILHRDLKPSNVLIDAQDHPRVTDFGLAKRLGVRQSSGALDGGEPANCAQPAAPITPDERGSGLPHSKASRTSDAFVSTPDADLTLTGQILGTPAYMSPEQASGRRGVVTVASDVYGLGAILYWLLTGRAPFAANSAEGVLDRVLHHEPAAPSLLHPATPRDLETICLKCLSKEPSRRYPSAQSVADDLQRWLNHEPIHARPVSPAERLWRWCRRKPALAGSIAAINLIAALGVAGILLEWRRAEQHASRETTERVRAEQAVTFLELQRAEDLLEKDEVTMGVAYLARLVRQQPTNQIAARRLLSALVQRNFALPVGPPLSHGKRLWYAEFSPDGRRAATASGDFTARIWDVATGQPLTAPLPHSSVVGYAGFSPDGERLVTFTRDSGAPGQRSFSAYLWEATTGRPLGVPMAHTKEVHSAQFSPDGKRVLTASDDGTARLWNAHTGESVLQPLTHQGPVRWARFSPDGRQIVTTSEDKVAQVWDSQTGQPAAKPFRHTGGVLRAEFSPDGKRVVTVTKDFFTCTWDIPSGEPLAKPLMHSGEIDTARFSPDGERILVALHNGVAQVFGARDRKTLAPPIKHRNWITAAEFSPEGQRIFTVSLDNTARLWDASTGEPLTPPMQHDGLIWAGRLSPDGLFAVTASADKTARIWDVRLGGMRSEMITHNAPVRAAEFSPDGERFVTCAEDGTVRIRNSRTGQQIGPTLRHQGWVVAAQFSPDGTRVATASSDGTARIWDVLTGQPLREPLRHGVPVDDVEFSPDGQTLATGSWGSTNVWLWKTETGERVAQPIPHQTGVHVLRFSPDGRWLLTDDFEADTAEIRDVASGRLLVGLRGHEGYVKSGEFSPNGQRVLTASEDGTARIWDARTGNPLTEPLRHKGQVPRAHFSRDGGRVVTGSDDSTAQVWDSHTGQPLGAPMRHQDSVVAAEFSPDGLLVVTASDDGTARLWDALTGRPVAEPFQHPGKVISAHFSPDGRRVLTASFSGTAHLWDVPPPIPSKAESGKQKAETRQSDPTGKSAVRHSPSAIDQSALASAATIEKEELQGALLADMAEAVIGKRVNGPGALESASSTDLSQIRQRMARLPHNTDFTRWLEWFFADRSTRTISPYSQVLLLDYMWSLAKDTNQIAWREALMLCPTNGYAFVQLAKDYLRRSNRADSAEAAQADWASRQALKFAPWDWWSWHKRAEVMEHTGRWTNLLAEAEHVISSQPDNHYAWKAKGRAFAALQQFEAAVAADSRAIEIGDSRDRFRTEARLRSDILHQRSEALRRLGRLAEASADHVASLGLPRRDPAAGANLIDLGLFYNGADEGFPRSVQRLAGVDFDFRAWIQLDVRLHRPGVTNLPQRVDGIPIERTCRRLHFVHTAVYCSYVLPNSNGVMEEKLGVSFGQAVGHYLIHYADGQQLDIPILHGTDVRDYWHRPESLPDDPALVVAWTSSDRLSREHGAITRFYKTTWDNPRPDVPILSLDFVHAMTPAVPILVAVTADP